MNALYPSLLLLTPGPGGAGSLVPFLLQIAAIFAIFYFLLIRPQQKQKQQHELALRNLKRGDEVVTTGGVVGEVVHIKESLKDGVATKAMDDRVTIKSGESRLIVERGRIARIAATASAGGSTTSS
jgi:preprotein translocase subunit YajC